MNTIVKINFFKFDFNVVNAYQIKMFIFNYLKNNEINDSFNFFHNLINLNNFIFLNYLFFNDIYDKKIDFDNINKIQNIIVN